MNTGTWTLKQLWDKACEYDRFPIGSKFVVFSDHNPWAEKYNFGINAALRTVSVWKNVAGQYQ